MSRAKLGEKQQSTSTQQPRNKMGKARTATPAAPASGPKSKKTLNPGSSTVEIQLSRAEIWLLDPKTFWRHLCTNRTNEEFIEMFTKLSQHANQELAKSALVPKSNSLPRNYLAWNGEFADDDPNDSAYPDLFLFMEKVYKASLYAAKFPAAEFLLSWPLPIRMGYAKADYTHDEIEKFMEEEETIEYDKWAKSMAKGMVINKGRLEQVKACFQAVQNTTNKLEVVKREALREVVRGRRRNEQGRAEPMEEDEDDGWEDVEEDEGDDEEYEEELLDINAELKKALASIVTRICQAGVVSRNFQKFIFDVSDGKPFDMSHLEPKDREYVITETQIVRARNVNGKLVFQLNDLGD